VTGRGQRRLERGMQELPESPSREAARFVVGAVADVETFLEKGYERDRYKCAALLPILADLMAKVWSPLRVQIFHAQQKSE